MIFISILTLIVAKALPSLNSNLSSIYFTRISVIIFVYAGVLSFNSLYIQSIGSGIYSGLFHVTQISHIIEIFLYFISFLILIAWPLILTSNYLSSLRLQDKNTNIIGNSSSVASVERDKLLDTNTSNINYFTDYSLIVLFSTMGTTLLISSSNLVSELLYFIKNFLDNYNLNLSLISFLKLIVIFLLIILHFYLIRVEYNNPKVCEYKYKCSGLNIKIKNFYALLATNIGLYASILSIKESNVNTKVKETSAKLEINKNKINALKEEIQKDANINLGMKNKIVTGTGRISVLSVNFIKNIKTMLTRNQELTEKHKTLAATSNPTQKRKILKEIEILQQDLSYREADAGKSMDGMKAEADNIKKTLGSADPNSEIIVENTNFNPFNLFENLDIFEKIAVSLLFSNSIIISSLISIVYIFYGDILLKKFNLEQRFPKLAYIINLRRKFQRYYLLIAVLFIFMSSLSQILFCLAILSL